MTYADIERARLLAGNVTLTLATDGIIAQAIAFGDSMVDTFTGKSDWTSADMEYAVIQTASEFFASSYIRDRFQDENTKAKAHYDRAMELCDKIRRGSQVLIATPDYRTYPLNEDATPYQGLSGANNSTDDSDLT